MKLKELMPIMFENVIICKQDGAGGDFENLYDGSALDIPDLLRDTEVKMIFARKKGIINIQIEL